MKRNIAIILAGGVGSRLGMSTPKQFFKVAGKMVVEHTIDVFERNQHIDEIAIVSNPALVADFENIVLRNKWRKVKKILKGGAERYYSSLSAITAYQNEDANLIFHDAVRPLVSQRIIDDVVKALDTHRAVNVAVPSADTIIEVDGDFITNIPDRSRLRRGQTPQAFDRQLISDAYDKALKDPNFRTTDDCGVVRTYLPEEPIFVVRGEESNMKLTYREDTYMMDKLFQLKSTEPNDVQIGADSFRGRWQWCSAEAMASARTSSRCLSRAVLMCTRSRAVQRTPMWATTTRWHSLCLRWSRRKDTSTTSSTPPACSTASRSLRWSTTPF